MHEDEITIVDVFRAASRAIDGLGNRTAKDLVQDWRTQSIVLHQLLVLGEAVKRLSQDFRQRHNAIPWRNIAGLRDVLIHAYDTVDVEMVWTFTTRDLPSLITYLESISPSKDRKEDRHG